MTSRDAVESLDNTDLEFGSLGEHLIYLMFRHNADKKGIIRLSMVELAAQLRVNRQTVVKHLEGLVKRQLVTRQGRGRYKVHPEPWSAKEIIRKHFLSMTPGDEWSIDDLERIVYSESLDAYDPRFTELVEYTDKLVKNGFLNEDAQSGIIRRTRKTVAA